jgi:hypothetical protein
MTNYYGQSKQDYFAIHCAKYKQNGFFLEIGSNHPITNNNTYLLESKYNWKGLMIEYDRSFEELYKLNRPNSIYRMQDATTVNYREIMDNNNFPINMDYLQIDLDVNNSSTINTLKLLDNTVFDKYKFASVTFEHDIYTGNYFNTQEISRKIFTDRGYVLLFPNVSVFYNNQNCEYEDWYVHPDLVDIDYIRNFTI